MEKIDILLWIVGAGFGMNFTLMIIAWSNITSRIDKLDEKMTDMDRRLCRMEGAFSSKDCCMLKSDQAHRKAE